MSSTDQSPARSVEEAGTQAVPPVVVVLVTHAPGDWFAETLQSLAAQDYPNVSVLVVDSSGEGAGVRQRVAGVLPEAHLRRVAPDSGFGAACNEALSAVEGAAFYLFCHDDVRLEPDVVQALVEEAFRSNAGVVGPKLVDWHSPDRLLSVGMGADRTGYPVPYVERGELDQAQHDAVREVFYVPGGATLVRADLFAALGGFDPGIDFHGDDLDLCWRAHVAGARVVVAPAARVGHLEALGRRRPVDDRRRLQMRHRLRAAKVSYGPWTRLRVVPQAFLLAVLEVLYCLVLGRFRQARDVAGAWTWNARRRGQIRARRAGLKGVRRVRDREVRLLQARGSARLAAFLRRQIGSSADTALESTGSDQPRVGSGHEPAEALRSSKARTALVVWAFAGVFLLVGSRGLLFGHLPAVADLPSFGGSASALVREWISGYRQVGLGAVAPNPTGIGAIGLLGYLTLGSMGLLRVVLVLGLLPVGAVGIWRLVKPIGSRRARVVALVVFLAVPLPYNALANGSWASLAVWAAVPWILRQLLLASGVAPFGAKGGDPGPGVLSRPLVQRVVAAGVLTALVATLVPAAVLLTPAIAVVLVVGGVLVGQVAGALRLLVTGFLSAVVAFVLHLPWSLGFLQPGWDVLFGVSPGGGGALDATSVLRFETGPWGAAPLGYAFLLVGALPLLIARGWRLAWAVRAWVLVLASMAVVWVDVGGWLPVALARPELLLAPAAAGLALAAGLGMAGFEVDLPDYHFGWRQILSVFAGAALVLGVVPVLGAATGGRWGLPERDFNRALQFLDAEGAVEPFRVLWIGDASVLPLAGWRLDAPDLAGAPGRVLAYGTSEDGNPDVGDRWAGDGEGPTVTQLGGALEVAAAGGTARLGALLAPMGVRYVVVPLADAPAPHGTPLDPPPVGLTAMLDSQLDLSAIDLPAGVAVYRNDAWGPSRALLPTGTAVPPGGEELRERTFPALRGAPVALPEVQGYQRFAGTLPPGVLYHSAPSDEQWRLEVGGRVLPAQEALGWAGAYAVDEGGEAVLSFETPVARHLALLGQALAWLVAVVYLLRVRVVTDESRELDDPAGTGGRPR